MKVNHYIGLIGWKSLKFTKTDRVYCDSIALYWLARIFRKNLNFLPGPKLIAQTNFNEECIFLLPFEKKGLPKSKVYILPMFNEGIYIDNSLKKFLAKHKHIKNLYVCISTPKQNILGQKISQYFDGQIHCIGAAVDIKEKKDEKNTLFLSKLNLLFLLFLFRSPSRTINKIGIVFREVFGIIFIKSQRKSFKAFLNSIY